MCQFFSYDFLNNQKNKKNKFKGPGVVLLRTVWSSEPLGGGVEPKHPFSRARRASLVERAGGPLPHTEE